MEMNMKGLIPVVFLVALSGCSKPTAEESFKTGESAQTQAEASLGGSPGTQDSLFLVAIGHFEEVVENHPDNPLAEASLFRIAELHNNGTRRFQEAINAYSRFMKTFPESSRAPVSLFMMGFLYNNELHDLPNASAAYKDFLARYPDHELAASASGELAYLGKSPEQIIEQQVTMSKEKDSGTGGQKNQ